MYKGRTILFIGSPLSPKRLLTFQVDPTLKKESIKYLKDAMWIYNLNPVPELIKDLEEEIEFQKKS